ncbi:unnamed protein product [Cuscuta epithymum]|uniref:Uncharacterized protein n=1 Tax=Cuscuta epithymum TaxID=186058 RepID=A0AAV0EIB1_9ASTE|nr:unnamed protein product [Cuscuta epithymum]
MTALMEISHRRTNEVQMNEVYLSCANEGYSTGRRLQQASLAPSPSLLRPREASRIVWSSFPARAVRGFLATGIR